MRLDIFDSPHTVGERDRDLDDSTTAGEHPIGHLDLEAVAVGLHRVEVDVATPPLDTPGIHWWHR